MHLLDRIHDCSFAQVVGFILSAGPGADPRQSLLYRMYRRLDSRRFATVDDPLEEVDLAARVARTPMLEISAEAELERLDLDVMLSFGADAIPRALVDCARHGIWSYEYGDPDLYRGGPPLFWEIYDGAPVSGSALCRITPGADATEPLYRSFSATDPLSLHRSRSRIYSKSADFVLRKLRHLHRDGELGAEPEDGPASRSAKVRRPPTNRQMLYFGSLLTARLAREKLRKAIARQQWFIAYRRRGGAFPAAADFDGAITLTPPADRFYADPCLVDSQGSSYLFFEEYDFAKQKGVVSYSRIADDGERTRPRVVLERPYHLSYPYVFFVGDEAFMLPETAGSGGIELYRAESFPDRWTLDAVLVRGVRAVDPTLIEHGGRFWLFANIAVDGASTNDELFLFHARAVRGPWEPHPCNPIVSDVRRARPAGRPFSDEAGVLIRPSQDCSSSYGSAVVFNRIEELSETGYRESAVGRLEPGWRRSNVGTHTYARSDRWEAVDGRAWVRKARAPRPVLRARR